uniref:5.3 kDa putative secretory protein n=1 Tax=Argas monolakensis TaxID=34602 RepID=Q09JU1_ARGMO|nr:5.3 kDa putative secretory protein [Argas monolakensis]
MSRILSVVFASLLIIAPVCDCVNAGSYLHQAFDCSLTSCWGNDSCVKNKCTRCDQRRPGSVGKCVLDRPNRG